MDLQSPGSGGNSVPAPLAPTPWGFLGCSRPPKPRAAPAEPPGRIRSGSLLAPTRPGVAIPGNHFPGKARPGNALGTSGRGGSLLKNPAGPAGWVRGKGESGDIGWHRPPGHSSGDRRTQRDPRQDAGAAPGGFPVPRDGEPGPGTLGMEFGLGRAPGGAAARREVEIPGIPRRLRERGRAGGTRWGHWGAPGGTGTGSADPRSFPGAGELGLGLPAGSGSWKRGICQPG